MNILWPFSFFFSKMRGPFQKQDYLTFVFTKKKGPLWRFSFIFSNTRGCFQKQNYLTSVFTKKEGPF